MPEVKLFKTGIQIKFFVAILIIHICVLNCELNASSNTDLDQSVLRVLVFSEDDGISIVGATVFITEQEGDTLRAGVTDLHGFVQFDNLSTGEYQIHVSSIGFEKTVQQVNLEAEQIKIVRIELETRTAQLDEVEVSAIRGVARREAGRYTISAEEINRVPSPGPGGDLTMFLQSLPSVVTTGDRGGELFIRGGTPAQNLITIDGMPIIKPFHFSNLFSAFPQEAISEVEVYAGGFGAEYMGATSAVLDVKLRQGNMRNYRGHGAVSPYLVSLQAEGPIKRDEQSFFLMGRYSVLESTAPALTGEDVPLQFYDLIGRYSINWDGLTCNISGIHTYDNGKINPVRNLELSWTNSTIGTRCLGFSEDLDHAVDFTIGFTAFNNTEKGIDGIGRESGIKKGYLKVDNSTNLFNLPVDYGFNLNFINYTAILDEPFAEQLGRGRRFLGLTPVLNDIVVSSGTYFSLLWRPVNNFIVKPGIASQIRLRDVNPTFEPRLRITWQIDGTDNKELTLALGRYFQMFDAIHDERDAGTVFYVYKPVATNDPFPESLHAILGYRHQFSNRFGFSVESFAKQHKNLPVARWTREPGNTLETGLAKSYAIGGDVHLEYSSRQFYFSIGYGLAQITYEAPSEEIAAWISDPVFRYNPAHDRRHQINAISSYAFKDYTFSINWQLSSGGTYTKIFAYDLALTRIPLQTINENRGTALTLFTEPFDGRMPSFNRLDASVSRTFDSFSHTNIDLEIGAINLMNVQNVFYFDANTNQQVNQLSLMPYAAVTFKFR